MVMYTTVAFCVVSLVICSSEPLSSWTKEQIPNAISGAISGYDATTNSMFILSPWNEDYGSSLIKYSLKHDKFERYEYPSPRSVFQEPLTNSFTSINDTIYFVSNFGKEGSESLDSSDSSDSSVSYLKGFNMSTAEWASLQLPLNELYAHDEFPCLTKSQNEQYLILIGGYSSDRVYFYDLTTNQIIKGPALNAVIKDIGCTVGSDGYLYTFGGQYDGRYDDKIRKLNVNDIAGFEHNQYKYEWEMIANASLNHAPQRPTVLSLDDKIYVIGGQSTVSHHHHSYSRDDHEYDECFDYVSYLDINHGKIYKTTPLLKGNCYGSGITVNSQIYLFGGQQYETSGAEAIYEISNTISSSSAPTASPTASPSAEPSAEPTKAPTNRPTAGPSAEPTKTPTNEPTEEPTKSPSDRPTVEPSSGPTKAPTNQPSALPTNAPTALPTSEPSVEPTKAPSNGPTEEPTKSPSNRPTFEPSAEPTKAPTNRPTSEPSAEPTEQYGMSSTYEPDPHPKSGSMQPSLYWIIIGGSVAAAVIIIAMAVICAVKRHKANPLVDGALLNH